MYVFHVQNVLTCCLPILFTQSTCIYNSIYAVKRRKQSKPQDLTQSQAPNSCLHRAIDCIQWPWCHENQHFQTTNHKNCYRYTHILNLCLLHRTQQDWIMGRTRLTCCSSFSSVEYGDHRSSIERLRLEFSLLFDCRELKEPVMKLNS